MTLTVIGLRARKGPYDKTLVLVILLLIVVSIVIAPSASTNGSISDSTISVCTCYAPTLGVAQLRIVTWAHVTSDSACMLSHAIAIAHVLVILLAIVVLFHNIIVGA